MRRNNLLQTSVLIVAVSIFQLWSDSALAQSTDPAIYIDFDTSGSMLQATDSAACYGDGSVEHPHYGACISRMYTAKNALTTAIYGYPEVRWGLARFRQQEAEQIVCLCDSGPSGQSDVDPSEEPGDCGTWTTALNYDLPGTIDPICINYSGGFGGVGFCSPGVACCDAETQTIDLTGADILVALAGDNEATILSWLDHQETNFQTGTEPSTGNHCWDGSNYGDCELRALGGTPIAGSLRDLYNQISTVDLGNDPQRGCRPYSVVLLTDGDESCENQGDATTAAADLLTTPDTTQGCGSACPPNSVCNTSGFCEYEVKTYVIAFALASTTNADSIAAAGGTVAAVPAYDEDDITAAMAQIVSEAVTFERCNGIDDNCDGQADEGFPVGQTCNNGLLGVCYAEGAFICDAGDDTTVLCDIPGGYPNPGDNAEICDGLDNDCDGEVDEDGVCTCNGPELCNAFDDYCDGYATFPDGTEDPRVGQPCGTDVGACVSGTTQCVGGAVICNDVGPLAEVCDANIAANDQNCNGVNNDAIAPQPCNVSNAFGTCDGLETCSVDGTWTCWARTPAPEDCNGIDDDCNSAIDDGLSSTCQVSNAWGTCLGTRPCTAGSWGACNAQTPAAETCDNTDEDCDGLIDEGLSQACQNTNGFGTCVGSQNCAAGSWSACAAQTPAAEICNNLDEDCDGLIDEGLSQTCYSGPAGTAGIGVCLSGTQSCNTGTWTGCVGEVVPQAEICDGLDNDCDTQTDENMGQTTCGLGVCQNTVDNCIGGSPQLCDPFAGAQPETCNGLDDDCDGVVDGLTETCYSHTTGCAETLPGVWSCTGVCSTGTRTCPVGGGGWGACQFDAGPSVEICDGLDNDCDGQIDEDAGGNPLTEVCYSPGSGPNTGCTYDVPTDAWSCTGACTTGVRTCTLGVLGPCNGEVTPAVEQCNTIDDDCDGQIDEPEDIPGLNQPCGTALGLCTPGVLLCPNGVPICQGGTGPFPGLCNGEDDDCDGQIDEADEVSQDPDIGLPCGDATGICEPGLTECFAGQLTCVGGVLPSEEVCDGTDNDCDTEIDEGDLCDAGFFCVQADCRMECDATAEFPCPGSLVCETVTVNSQTVAVCLPPLPDCGGETCPEGWTCLDNQCVNLCDPDPCQGWEECHQGICVDVSCSGLGQDCPDGQFCLNHDCEPDPCEGAGCEALGGYCVRLCDANGCAATCHPHCLCAPDERCDAAGECVADVCAEVACDLGERCNAATAQCEPDPCASVVCTSGEVCFEGACVANPCFLVDCPRFFDCEIAVSADATGDPAPDPQCVPNGVYWVEGGTATPIAITATGRGGCSTSGAPTSGVWLWGLLLLGLVGIRWRRRWRRRLCKTSAVALVLPLIFTMGCKVNTYYGHEADGGHYTFPDGDVLPDDASVDGGDGATCEPTEEICDGLDNDCNGVVDNVDASRLADDIHNCGDCGHACDLLGAFPACVGGACVVDYCFPGHHDLNGDPVDGCEFDCAVTNGGIEVCDGVDNNCNGVADENFDLQNDPNNCGACFAACSFFQGAGACVAGHCELSGCNGAYVDLDADAANGCECQMGVTEGSTTCDPTNPTACVGGEVCADVDNDNVSHCAPIPADGCDGVDNNCDGQIDEDAPAILGGTDCYTHPVGCTETSPGVFTCAGACQPGVPTCVAANVVCGGQTGPSAEICDGLDNDCDGTADDGFDLTSDVTNCGGCNVFCPSLAGANSYATSCVAGTCQFTCQPGFHDIDGDLALGNSGTGCEYGCTLSGGGVEACGDGLDNDCNGQIDEGFDLVTDPANCGGCGISCAANTPFQATSNGCAASSCVYVCQAGFNDADGDLALGAAGTGCEYVCTTSNGGTESCDDLDNDCDGLIDEDYFKQTNPANCGSCGYQCASHTGPNSVVAGCAGGVCQFACAVGWVDTNGDVSLGTVGDGCDYACTLSNGGVEICDGFDNDCNGMVDDDGAGALLTLDCYSGPMGTQGVGTCRAGTRTCSGGSFGVCLGEVLPQVELCDNLDNDCDWQVDNGIDTSTDINNCGACQSSCWTNMGANAYPSACVAGACQYSCIAGFSDLNGDLSAGVSGDGCEYTCPENPPGLEYCDGVDNDCNGLVDDGLTPPVGYCYAGVDGPGPPVPGSPENNPCSGVTANCMDPDGAGGAVHDWYCQYPAAVETEPLNSNQLLGYETLCDGYDGDCDGAPDDSFNAGQACDDGGVGACRSTGTIECRSDLLGSECVISTPGATPADEICDGVDNDCDGLTDETSFDNNPANDPGGSVLGWVVDDVVTISVAGVDTYVYRYESSHPTATFSDGGLGTAARACSVPDVIPWSFLSYSQAAEACARAGMRLCRADEWEETCDGSNTRVYPYGDTYNPTACNGHDMDPADDQVEPTGTQSGCASQGYSAEDLSGNLREWTADFVGLTGDGRRVFRLRGGSYIDLDQGLRCDFGANAYVEDALASHVGFRCCSTCGNGTVDRGEACDPVLEPATCHPAHCGYLTCGDGNLDAGEDCDDGNLLPADGCSPACLAEAFCGDSVVAVGEDCDDGNGTPFDGCSPLCTNETLLMTENMQSCPVGGGSWTVDNGGGASTWYCQPNFNNTNSASGGRYAIVLSTAAEQFAEGLITPVQDLSGYTKAQLSFYHAYLDGVGVDDSAQVQYSVNGVGGPWTTVATYAGADYIGIFVTVDVSGAAGQPNAAFRFYYDDNNQDGGWWQIDDVELRAY